MMGWTRALQHAQLIVNSRKLHLGSPGHLMHGKTHLGMYMHHCVPVTGYHQ